MAEQTKNMMIGLFVIAACVLIVWLILFLKPGVGNSEQTLYVRFSNINRINVGTRVLFAGKPVGEVVAITEIYDARQKPVVDREGHIFYYQLTLKVDSSVKLYSTDEVTIQTSGLLGEKSIAIIPREPPSNLTPKRITDQPFYAESADPIEQAFSHLGNLSTEMEKTFKQAREWLEKNSESLGHAVCAFGQAMDEVRVAVHSVNTLNVIPEAQRLIQQATCTITDIRAAIQQMQDGGVFTNAGPLVHNLKEASSHLNNIAHTIASGQGTIGKIIYNDDLYLRFNAILSKADTMMNDINHYGFLFHLNKSWQRQRAQRITTLNALDTPQNFKNYFEKEVDNINTAMARLSMLIDRAQLFPKKEEILQDAQFRRDFAELLKETEELANNLKLYNEQLAQIKE